MRRQVPIREVNQHLSRYIKAVENGEDIIITKRGKAVARLSAIEQPNSLNAKQEEALARSLERMRKGYDLGGQAPNRENLHER